jgi:hypothetical protein
MATGQAPEQTLLSLDEVICDGTAVCLARSIAWSEGHAPLCLCFLPIATISEVYDQAIVMGGVGILTRYAVYCNELKTHRSLGKDAPVLAPPSTYALIASEQVVRGLRRSASGARGIAVAHREAFR